MSLSAEMDLWLEEQQALANPRPGRHSPQLVGVTERDTETVPPCPLTDAEIDWLWQHYQRCSFPPATFAKRFARTPRSSLTPRGKNACVRLAFHYRRQIFWKAASKWTEAEFLDAVRNAASNTSRAGGLCADEHDQATTSGQHTNSPAAPAPVGAAGDCP
ncbi:MAG TPA: hypothetical protein VK163_08855 [Opitutaceae bacterium]|nr:hypothetical protein [Opitutaceae bacterium]